MLLWAAAESLPWSLRAGITNERLHTHTDVLVTRPSLRSTRHRDTSHTHRLRLRHMSRKPGSIHVLQESAIILSCSFEPIMCSGPEWRSSRVSPLRHSRPCRGLWPQLRLFSPFFATTVHASGAGEEEGTAMEAMEGDTTRSAIEACGSSADAGGEVDVTTPAPKVKETRGPTSRNGKAEGCGTAPHPSRK